MLPLSSSLHSSFHPPQPGMHEEHLHNLLCLHVLLNSAAFVKYSKAVGDHKTAFEYLIKAAELGDAKAHFLLSCLYHKGQGVEKDEKKEVYHSEEAAVGGHPHARHNLGCEEWNNGRFERLKKHYIIAANLGFQDSLKGLKGLYADEHASKEDYAAALRAYQAVADATKSRKRERVEEALNRGDVVIMNQEKV